MNKINEAAWSILTDDERMALTLKHGHDKSSWEAGEIVGRAHYKFLEIESRAKQFLSLFTEHFNIYDKVIPKYIKIDDRVKKYFTLLIADRRSIKEAIDLVNDDYFDIKSFRDRLIIEAMEKLNKSEQAINKNIAIIVWEFDRWNNFRILPREIQEPSAFKRRNKNADLRNLKNLLTLHTYSVEELIKRYHVTKPQLDQPLMFAPIFSKFFQYGGRVITISHEQEYLDHMSKIGLYCFNKKDRATKFFDLVNSYKIGELKDCKFGQKFWPRFRLVIKDSLNYNTIQKRIPSRKFLENALEDLDIRVVNQKETDPYFRKQKKLNEEAMKTRVI